VTQTLTSPDRLNVGQEPALLHFCAVHESCGQGDARECVTYCGLRDREPADDQDADRGQLCVLCAAMDRRKWSKAIA